MTQLVLSILVLAVAPLLYRGVKERAETISFLDGFIVASIAGLTLLTMPELVARGGVLVIACAVAGLLGPTLLERYFQRAGRGSHAAALWLGIAGVCLHALLDGAGLAGDAPHLEDRGAAHLPAAIILHRFPVGLTVWWLVRPPYGLRAAWIVLACMAASTAVGYAWGDAMHTVLSTQGTAWFQGLVTGSLLHVVAHRPHVGGASCGGEHSHSHSHDHAAASVPAGAVSVDAERRRSNRLEGTGAVIGLILVAGLWWSEAGHGGHSHGGHTHGGDVDSEYGAELASAFLDLALESAPALLLGYVLAGLFSSFLPRSTVAWMQRGRAATQSLRGMAVGLPFPVCSCGVVPLYRALILRGAPAPAAMAFLIATPELGLDAVLLSFPLLGAPMAILRVAGAAVLAFVVGWLVGRRVRASASAEEASPSCCGSEPAGDAPSASFGARLASGLRLSFGEILDSTAPWILLGLGVAAVVAPFVDDGWLRSVPAGLDIPLFAVLGVPMYVCAAGVTPLVAVLLAGGVSPGAALVFLLTGPATNVTTFGVLSQLHGKRIAVAFSLAMFAFAIALGYAVNALPIAITAPDSVLAHEHDVAWWRWASLGVLGLLYLDSLRRRGPRLFARGVMPSSAPATSSPSL